ncbi:MAG: hypothetical protein LBT95_02355 [Treponema sp.]|jgi:hypothetical protein|nr:hypothetical protein [Treponema sp.]
MKKSCLFGPPLAMMALVLMACPAGSSGNGPDSDDNGIEIKTGKVIFFNESSYTVTVLLGAFSGPVLIESLGTGQSKKVDVRISDNYGVGSTFCIEYAYKVVDGTDLASGEVWAKGIDPNIQINFVVEENKSYTKQIPQPAELEFPKAFVKILNASSMQFELRKHGTAYKQTGNGNLPVPPGKTGVYEIPSAAEGVSHGDYSVYTTFNAVSVPEFTAKNSYVYSFSYNGTSVVKTGEQKIVF